MKHSCFILLFAAIWFFLNPVAAFSQKHDNIWVAGIYEKSFFDTAANHWFGNSIIDFSNSSISLYKDTFDMGFHRANTSVCDSSGRLLFCSNGYTIRSADGSKMENGDSLAYGWLARNYDQSYQIMGYPRNMQNLCLPLTGNRYLYCYHFEDSSYLYSVINKRMLFALIDMNENNGKGRVLFKDSTLLNKEVSYFISAVKTADNQGWWLITMLRGTNCYEVIQVDLDGNILNSKIHCSGLTETKESLTVATFSNDGSRFVSSISTGNAISMKVGISVFDFSRCNGELILVDSFYNKTLGDSILPPLGIESSLGSRYMYLFATSVIYQIDLQSSDVRNSLTEVAKWDGFLGPFPTDFVHGQLAADGKIYVNSGSGNYYISVIENPDDNGINCNVKQHHIQTPTFISGLPRSPNYRLNTTDCNSTSVSFISSDVGVVLYPNPATNYIQIEYDGIRWKAVNNVNLKIRNTIGQEVYNSYLAPHSSVKQIEVSSFANGMYFFTLEADGRLLSNGKFVKQ